VAARKPRGLAAIIPWEGGSSTSDKLRLLLTLFVGMTDYYRDRVRHGGILANNFVKFWWENQVGPMQYGTAEKKPRRFGKLRWVTGSLDLREDAQSIMSNLQRPRSHGTSRR